MHTIPGSPRAEAASHQDEPLDADRRSSGVKFHAFLAAAGDVLAEQPSKRSTRAAGLRLHRALTALVDDVAGRKAC